MCESRVMIKFLPRCVKSYMNDGDKNDQW